MNSETVSNNLKYLEDSFLFSKAERFDVKGKQYFSFPSKYYCTDVGLRNVKLGLRQQEQTRIMENIIYNELRARGYFVDVGIIQVNEKDENGKYHPKNLEVDFIARKGMKKYYIQSAWNMEDPYKEQNELRPLYAIDDFFRKIVVSKSTGKSWIDEKGTLRIELVDFLLDQDSLDR